MDGKTILVIDDDINLSKILQHTFKREGATVYTAADGREGLHLFFAHRPDLVLLDIRMPDVDGWETCRQIRLLSNTPIIMLTTLNREEEIVRGLDLGANDFVTKPFSRQVLLARTRAALRRNDETKTEQPHVVYRDDYLVVDLQERCVLVKGEQVKLSAREFSLLSYLVENAGRILTHQQILDRIWGWEYRDNPDYLHVYFSHLRRKLEKDPKNPEYLRTEHGVGYRFYKVRYH